MEQHLHRQRNVDCVLSLSIWMATHLLFITYYYANVAGSAHFNELVFFLLSKSKLMLLSCCCIGLSNWTRKGPLLLGGWAH